MENNQERSIYFFFLQVFALTGLMSYIIPEVPRSVATQWSRERLLAQEAKYEKGVKGQDEEDDLLAVLRDAGLASRPGANRHGWARRFSKLSDGLDAHVEISGPRHSTNNKNADGSAMWEVT